MEEKDIQTDMIETTWKDATVKMGYGMLTFEAVINKIIVPHLECPFVHRKQSFRHK